MKYKQFTFNKTVENNSSTVLYDYSNDEDLKNAEMIGVVPRQIILSTSVTWVYMGINAVTKEIFINVGNGQSISGTYYVLYK